MKYNHIPVLESKVIDMLVTNPEGVYIDATAGGGGHSLAILKRLSNNGKLIAIDQDIDALLSAKEKFSTIEKEKTRKQENGFVFFSDRVILVQSNFRNLKDAVNKIINHQLSIINRIDGVLFDLGVSSYQIDNSSRGFSFQSDGPLDMRMDTSKECTAEKIINELSQEELIKIIRNYGEEKHAGIIVREIIKSRKKERIKTTKQLVDIIKKVTPYKLRQKTLARVFQSFRIAVNNELDNLKDGLNSAIEVLSNKGRIAVISYHSLEDRIVKNFFRSLSKGCICPPYMLECVCGRKPILKEINRKVIRPSDDEIRANPRARSAKLRVAEVIANFQSVGAIINYTNANISKI